MVSLIRENQAKMYELVENFRSKSNLVEFANQFVQRIPQRLKKTPIIPHQTDLGKIKLVKYLSQNGDLLINPLVQDILKDDISGSTCVLTRTNDEALQITGLLVEKGLKAKLIQSNEGFNLFNLVELRYFLDSLALHEDVYTISDEVWGRAKASLKEKYSLSINYEICVNLIKDFEAAHPNIKYKSDLETFVRESKLEDFLRRDNETIFVSTIHKAKGWEFDNVYMLLQGYSLRTAEEMRQLYVGMTRAKQNLTIHYDSNYLDRIAVPGTERLQNTDKQSPPELLAVQLGHKDVWLDFFQYPSNWQRLEQLISGDELSFDREGCRNAAGQWVLKFSQKFKNDLERISKNGYVPCRARVRFILYWLKEGTGKEVKIVLPELYFERK